MFSCLLTVCDVQLGPFHQDGAGTRISYPITEEPDSPREEVNPFKMKSEKLRAGGRLKVRKKTFIIRGGQAGVILALVNSKQARFGFCSLFIQASKSRQRRLVFKGFLFWPALQLSVQNLPRAWFYPSCWIQGEIHPGTVLYQHLKECSLGLAIYLCKMLLIAAETSNSLQAKSVYIQNVQAGDRSVLWYYDLLFKNMPSQTKNCQ